MSIVHAHASSEMKLWMEKNSLEKPRYNILRGHWLNIHIHSSRYIDDANVKTEKNIFMCATYRFCRTVKPKQKLKSILVSNQRNCGASFIYICKRNASSILSGMYSVPSVRDGKAQRNGMLDGKTHCLWDSDLKRTPLRQNYHADFDAEEILLYICAIVDNISTPPRSRRTYIPSSRLFQFNELVT